MGLGFPKVTQMCPLIFLVAKPKWLAIALFQGDFFFLLDFSG